MKQALLITYYFPPAGGVSAQRILKFARYLPSYGYRPTVLTVDQASASYPALDPALRAQLPASVNVVRTRAWDPLTAYARLQGKRKEDVVGIGFVKEDQSRPMQRFGRWVRGNVFLPDARVGWVPYARRAARRLVRDNAPDVIMTTGPPHSTHFIGSFLQRRYGIPWVADFRDPWSDYFFNANMLQTRFARSVIAHMERKVLTRADAVLSVSDGVGEDLQRRAEIGRYETLPNGYDPADLVPIAPMKRRDDAFVIAHVGTLTREQHVPGLFKAVADLGPGIELRFVGHVHADVMRAGIEMGLEGRLRLTPFVPHTEAITHMRQADVLMVSIGSGHLCRGIVSGKVFEYLGIGVPILGLGEPDGDLAALLDATGGGRVFRHDDAAGIRHFLRGLIDGTIRIQAQADAVHKFDRRVLTQRLASVFDALVNSAQ